MEKMQSKLFKVASVSENTNSFGLWGMILMAEDGETWEVAANSLNKKTKGDLINVPLTDEGRAYFATLGFEIPTPRGIAPPAVVKEVFDYVAA